MLVQTATNRSLTSRLLAIALFALAMLLVACGVPGTNSGSGPEKAAEQGLQTWAAGNSVAYRNATFKTGVTGNDFANVEVIAELPVKGSNDAWLENRAFVQVQRQNGNWQAPFEFKFELTTAAISTQEAGKGATATAQVQAARATQTTLAQGQIATATAYSQGVLATNTAYAQGQSATATAYLQAQAATATAQVQARQAAAATSTQSVYATATAQTYATGTAVVRERPTVTAASADFTGTTLPAGWIVNRPDPARWQLNGTTLQHRPVKAIASGSYYNTFYRALPTLISDLDIVMKLNSTPQDRDSQFWLLLTVGQTYDDIFGVGISLGGDGSLVRSYSSSYSNPSVTADITGDIYLRITRREAGKKYSAYYSRDGQTWTFVAEREGRAYNNVSFTGVSPVKPGTPPGTTPTPARNVTPEATSDYVVNVYWVHFEVPKTN